MSKYSASRENNGLKTHTRSPIRKNEKLKVRVVTVLFSVYGFSCFDVKVVIKKLSDLGIDTPNAAEGAVVMIFSFILGLGCVEAYEMTYKTYRYWPHMTQTSWWGKDLEKTASRLA